MQATGHVYPIALGSFAVVCYFPTTEVFATILPECDTVTQAIKELGRTNAGQFVAADSDVQKWGEVIVNSRGYYAGL